MKKSIIATICVIILAVVALLIFSKTKTKYHDVSFNSYDQEATLTLKEIASLEPNRNTFYSYNYLTFSIVDLTEGVKKITETDGYQKSFTSRFEYTIEDVNIVKEFECYLFMKRGHYFLVSHENGEEEKKYSITELVGEMDYSNGNENVSGYYISPIAYEGRAHILETGTEDFCKWQETAGLQSYEDLVAYYEQTDKKGYSCNDLQKSVTVNIYQVDYNNVKMDTKWRLQITAKDEGIAFKVYALGKKIDED